MNTDRIRTNPDSEVDPTLGRSDPNLYILSYSGRKVGPNFASPSLLDIAVQQGRICRYAGACVRYWPVLLHSFVVADLARVPALRVYALLHDGTEAVIGDIPRGFKSQENKQVEEVMFEKLLTDLSLPPITIADRADIKEADNLALLGEVWTVGTAGLREEYPRRSRQAEELVLKYANQFSPADCISPDGLAVLEFGRRYRDYSDLLNLTVNKAGFLRP